MNIKLNIARATVRQIIAAKGLNIPADITVDGVIKLLDKANKLGWPDNVTLTHTGKSNI